MKKKTGKSKRRSDCPISFALDIFGDKWSLLIVRDIIFRGKTSYGEFLESEEHIATNILANRLALLENAEIIEKTAHTKDKRKDIYTLTRKGIDLLPMLLEVSLWSAKYDPQTGAPKKFVSQLKKDKKRLIEQIRVGIKKNKFLFKQE